MGPMSTRPQSPAEVRARAAKARRRRTLGIDAIVEVTLAVIDAEGIEAVSMRRVAAEFDTGPASLYAYVSNKDELLRLVLEQVVNQIVLPDGDLAWQELVRAWAHETRRVLREHNDVALLTFGTIPVTPAMLAAVERLLRSMIEGGVPAQVATWALDITSLYIGADVYEGYLLGKRFHEAARTSGRAPEELGAEYFQRIAAGFADLPRERYPYLVGNLDAMMTGGDDARFAFGIDMLIAGFEAQRVS